MTMQCNKKQFSSDWLQKANSKLGLKISVDEFNQRLIIKDSGIADTNHVIKFVKNDIPDISWLGKIIIFSREFRWKDFVSAGFRLEGFMNNYYDGAPAYLVSKFIDSNRFDTNEFFDEDDILEKVTTKPVNSINKCMSSEYIIRDGRVEDIPQLIKLYNIVFDIYPTPINDPHYLKSILGKTAFFKVLEYQGTIISAASADVDFDNKAAEMTDCATLPAFRGKGLMYEIIGSLEHDMKERGIVNLFSLARAKSHGSNRVFYSLGYQYTGRLINNCQICRGYEDINIWEKRKTS